ncbi:HNH endonuclease family protein [Chitinophaga agri]|uniref:HNH endonuclease n=1 Tax=Chitinophaga agri TaxID=2703787 RepID=A0A6B9ZFS3_9BACT|nr:hypothetical protein [Chitinophaga agri]QHS61248.1 hypothetical protein GWR21_17075 [Chitinophaga agri]
MIYINPTRINVPAEWEEKVKELKAELLLKKPDERIDFINSKRNETWGHPEILKALRKVIGNKCWYSEVDLTGADPNIDHFRPKGAVSEIDPDSLTKTGAIAVGYWWLAFDKENFRLSSMHSNQRRVDETTQGGKWDFFPVLGSRAQEGTNVSMLKENVLPLDPCSPTDVSLMWFEPDGKPGFRNWRRVPTLDEERRMRVTIWLFHLDKHEIAVRRANAMEDVRTALKNADAIFQIWQLSGGKLDNYERNLFDNALTQIKSKIADDAPFAGAKRCVIQLAKAEYDWIQEYMII